MRNLPTVLFALHDDDLLVQLPVEQAHITHNHPLSDTAVVCVARMLARLLHGVIKSFALPTAVDGLLCAPREKDRQQQ